MKKKILLFIALIVLLVPAFIFLVPVKDGRTIYKNIKYKQLLAGATQPDNYDKMKIKYARITERKTGTAKFNTPDGSSVDDGSIVSDLEGNDVSNKDNYIRTYDDLVYTIEVGVERNPDTTSDTDVLSGGVIKVKVTIPQVEDNYSWLAVKLDTWMKNFNRSSDLTSLTAEYQIPVEDTIIGGNQEITLRFHAQGFTGKLPDNMKPIIEVWMEGNKPDNSSSTAESVFVEDDQPLYFSGQQKFNLTLKTGYINRGATLDGVKGNYINFGTVLNFGSPKEGSEYPYNGVKSKIRLEYYYRNANSNDEWIKLDRANDQDREILDGIRLVSYGLPYMPTQGYWPNENSNIFKDNSTWYKGINILGNSPDYSMTYNSGDLTASYSEEILTFENHNNYFQGYLALGVNFFLTNGFEFFIPHYEGDGADYEYQIKLVDYELQGYNYRNEMKDLPASSSLIVNFSKNLNGNVGLSMIANNCYGCSERTVTLGRTLPIRSVLSASDGPYEGGEDRLIVWNSSLMSLERYSNGNGYDRITAIDGTGDFTTENMIVKYGIYKNNSSEGITDNSLINPATYEDFDWYDTYDEAALYGKITAVYFNDPDFRGYNNSAEITIYLRATTNSSATGKIGFVKHSAKLYADAERNNYYTAGYNTEYIPTQYDAEGNIVRHSSSPNLGHTYILAALSANPAVVTRNVITNEYDTTFNVKDKYINVVLYNRITNYSDDDVQTNFKLVCRTGSNLTYREGSASIEPSYVGPENVYGNGQRIEWILEDVDSDLDNITLQLEMSPFAANNSYSKIDYHILTPAIPSADTSSSADLYFINLSGSSMRENINKDYLETNENFEITSFIYNISDDALENIKTIEILPKDGDERESSFSGNYEIKVLELGENQTIYYTTNEIGNIGLSEDGEGNSTIENVDLPNDNRWIQINVGETIPSNATAIATMISSIETKGTYSYKYQVLPNGNKGGDKYIFKSNASSDNLTNSISSDILRATIRERKISGTVFEDLNRNDLLNDTDAKLNNYTLELLNGEGTKIDETTTDNNGQYEFVVPQNGNYFIRFTNLPEGYELTPKGSTENHSKVNESLVTDLIEHNDSSNIGVISIKNINVGIRKKQATLIVKYLDKNNDQPLANQFETTVYYTDPYETTGIPTIPENYSFLENAGDPVSDVVNKDEIVVIYYYDYTPATVTAKHYIDGTSTKIHEDVIQNKKFTQLYSTSALDTTNLNYEYVRTDGDSTNGIVDKTDIVVNYFYKLKTGVVTTHHYLYDNGETTTKLATDVVREWNYTEIYTTSTSNEVPSNYEFYKKSDNYTAVMGSPSVVVNYYYRLKDSSLTTSINVVGTEEITSKDFMVDYEITYNAKVVDYIGNGTITIIDTLPYSIDVDNSDLDGGTYDDTDRTITWEVDWSNIDTYAGRDENVIKKNISLKYIGIVGRDRIMTNNVHSNILLSNSSRDAEAQTSTNIRINGNIKVVYIDKDTGEELADAVEETNLVGEEFISSAIEKDGYKLVTKPDSEEFEFEEEEQTITYEYEHIKYEIRAVVQGVGGKISGDEDVFWGEDSTIDNIVIEAEEGYIIEAIYINGIRQELVLGEEKVILSNFINVLENKNIEVVFAKKPQENPNTKASMGKILLVSWLIFFTLVILLKKTKELE